MSLLTLDIGNTRIGAARVIDRSVEDHFQGSPVEPGHDSGKRAAEAFDWCMDQEGLHDDIEGLVLSSVVPTQADLLEAMWLAHPTLSERPLHRVTHESPMPMGLDVDEPATVGADRFCNVAGAMVLGHRNAIVVDLGTANTFDVLEGGVFRGGLIGAGAVTAHRALVEAGARLPDVVFAWPEKFVGRNTAAAIRAGSFYQAVGGARYVIDQLRERFPGATVMVTGGLAEMLGPELGDQTLHVPDLTHVGAAAIGRAAAI